MDYTSALDGITQADLATIGACTMPDSTGCTVGFYLDIDGDFWVARRERVSTQGTPMLEAECKRHEFLFRSNACMEALTEAFARGGQAARQIDRIRRGYGYDCNADEVTVTPDAAAAFAALHGVLNDLPTSRLKPIAVLDWLFDEDPPSNGDLDRFPIERERLAEAGITPGMGDEAFTAAVERLQEVFDEDGYVAYGQDLRTMLSAVCKAIAEEDAERIACGE